jgi:hypothetical protein
MAKKPTLLQQAIDELKSYGIDVAERQRYIIPTIDEELSADSVRKICEQVRLFHNEHGWTFEKSRYRQEATVGNLIIDLKYWKMPDLLNIVAIYQKFLDHMISLRYFGSKDLKRFEPKEIMFNEHLIWANGKGWYNRAQTATVTWMCTASGLYTTTMTIANKSTTLDGIVTLERLTTLDLYF